MLADWAPEDIAGFTAYLSRFGDALEASRATLARHGANPHDTQEN
jgi:hypothetical protein